MVAIGRDAGAALVDFEIPVITVRHPSYGGQSDFIAGLQTIYGLNEGPIENRTLELPF
ncbi:hypothetical protein MesoLjLc_67460 [Mesorhizobium sp. L-8-10]|nr:hypothetical protein MesoLjLc_67460 [Mesorhizobium sp. L-8-10]